MGLAPGWVLALPRLLPFGILQLCFQSWPGVRGLLPGFPLGLGGHDGMANQQPHSQLFPFSHLAHHSLPLNHTLPGPIPSRAIPSHCGGNRGAGRARGRCDRKPSVSEMPSNSPLCHMAHQLIHDPTCWWNTVHLYSLEEQKLYVSLPPENPDTCSNIDE